MNTLVDEARSGGDGKDQQACHIEEEKKRREIKKEKSRAGITRVCAAVCANYTDPDENRRGQKRLAKKPN